MRRKPLLLAAVAAALLLAAPAGGGSVVPTVRLAISHVVSNCHVWSTAKGLLAPSTKIVVEPGTRVVLRSDCPMDFDLAQKKGPRLALGAPRMFAGTSRTLVFKKAGVYVLTATNVQTPEERNLVTLGTPNLLTLTVVVKRA